MDLQAIKQAAEGYRADMTAFLRAMISHPSESCQEKEVVLCIKAEMEKLGYDKVEIDGLGKVIGRQGKVAKCLRSVMRAAAAKENRRVIVDIVQA